MLRKRATPEATGKAKNERSAGAQRLSPSGAMKALPVARDQSAVKAKAEARLKTAAKEAFQNMGED